ncbi:MAG: transglycosylase SLT domain-containing protein, partial [Dehalococcoidia bacterium]
MHLTRPRTVARPLAVAAAAFVAMASPACFDSGDPAPTPTAVRETPAPAIPMPTPSPSPADPNLGDQLRYEGDFEGAIGVYASIAAESDGEDRQQARFSQAQLLQRGGSFAEARDVLGAYLIEAGAAADGSPARFLFASVLDDLADPQGALDSYQLYINAGGDASAFAQVERAKMLARLGRFDEAEAAAQAVMASDLRSEFKNSFMISVGGAFEQGGADANALAWYTRAATSGADVATARARSAAIKQRLGDVTWVDDYASVVAGYPAGAAATDALAALDAAAVPVRDYDRGLVHYRAFRNTAAREAFGRAIAAGDRAAQSSYYVGAIEERESNVEPAIAAYQRAHDLDPASPQSDDALWWRARLLEVARRYDEAGAAFAQLVAEYPASEWAADANFHRGMVLYRNGDPAGAAFAWGAIATTATDDEARAKARFWQGRAQMAAGNPAGEQTLQQLVQDAPDNFYALRAEVLLEDNDDGVKDVDVKDDDIDWGDIAEYFEETYAVDPDATPPAIDARWDLARELRSVGLRPQGDAVYLSLIDDAAASVAGLFHVTRRFEEEGDPAFAARAATRLLAELRDDDKGEPPDDLLRVAYPQAYADLVQDASDEHDVSPLLLLALVRQESYYDPEAGSTAGALGLTQVIEGTGRAIADDLGVFGFTVADLFRPRLSLRFGASYLADQLAQFDGNVYHALAAYNGGPGTAANAI